MTEPNEANDDRQQMSDALLSAELSWNIQEFKGAARQLRKEKGMSIQKITSLQLPKSTIWANFDNGNGKPSNANQVRFFVRACGVSMSEEDRWVTEWERSEAERPPSVSTLPQGDIAKAQHYLRAMMRLTDVATHQTLRTEETIETLSRIAAIVYGTAPPPAVASVPHNLHEVKRDLQQLVNNIDSIKKSTQNLLGLI